MGEHLPCKQGVKSSNLSVSIQTAMSAYGTLKTSYRKRIDLLMILTVSNQIIKTSENKTIATNQISVD